MTERESPLDENTCCGSGYLGRTSPGAAAIKMALCGVYREKKIYHFSFVYSLSYIKQEEKTLDFEVKKYLEPG